MEPSETLLVRLRARGLPPSCSSRLCRRACLLSVSLKKRRENEGQLGVRAAVVTKGGALVRIEAHVLSGEGLAAT